MTRDEKRFEYACTVAGNNCDYNALNYVFPYIFLDYVCILESRF